MLISDGIDVMSRGVSSSVSGSKSAKGRWIYWYTSLAVGLGKISGFILSGSFFSRMLMVLSAGFKSPLQEENKHGYITITETLKINRFQHPKPDYLFFV